MKKIFFLFTIVLAVWGCSKKITPTATTTSTTTEANSVTANVSSESIAAGESTYKAKCGRCHGLPDVSNYTSEKWVGLVNWMAPKAKLDDTEKNNVLNYVQANAKKS